FPYTTLFRSGQLGQGPREAVGEHARDDARAVEADFLQRAGRVAVLRAVAHLRRLAVLADAGEIRREDHWLRARARVQRNRGDFAVGREPPVAGEAQHRTAAGRVGRVVRAEPVDVQVGAVFVHGRPGPGVFGRLFELDDDPVPDAQRVHHVDGR